MLGHVNRRAKQSLGALRKPQKTKSSHATLNEGELSQVNRRARPSQVKPSQVEATQAKSRCAELSKAALGQVNRRARPSQEAQS